jgi:O-antigen/teichoic acid export membrane protein
MPQAGPTALGSRALRNTALILCAKVGSRLIGLVTVLAVLNYLQALRYGTFTTLVSYTGIISVLLDLGFNVLFLREGARHPEEVKRYLRNLVSLRALMSVGAFAVLAGALTVAGLESLLMSGFALMVLASYASLLRTPLYALQRLGYEAVALVLESVVLLALVLVGIKTGQGLTYFVWAYAAQYAFSCVYFLVVLAWKRIATIGWRFEPELLVTWFWKGLPFALTFVLTVLYFKIDQPIVYALRTHEEAGWYAAAYKPFEALMFIPMTLLSVAFPALSLNARQSGQMTDAVNGFFKGLFLIGWPLSVGMFLIAHPLTGTLRLYGASEPALRILAIALVIGFVNSAFIGALSASDRQMSFTWAAGWSLVANLALNLALIPSLGYLGASWATVITEVVLFAAGWILTARHVTRVPVIRLTWRAALAGLVMGAVVFPLRDLDGPAIAIPIIVGAVTYAITLFVLRAITRDEVTLARTALRIR